MGRKPEGLVGSQGKGSILEWNLSAADQVPGFPFEKNTSIRSVLGTLVDLP